MARDAFVIGGIVLAIVQTWLAIRPSSSMSETRVNISPGSNAPVRLESQPARRPRRGFAEQPFENQLGLATLFFTALAIVFGYVAVMVEKRALWVDALLGLVVGACFCVSLPGVAFTGGMFLKKTEEMEPTAGRTRRTRLLMAWSSLTLLCTIDVALTKTPAPLGRAFIYMWALGFLVLTFLAFVGYILRRLGLNNEWD
jgi:hypothetical protein